MLGILVGFGVGFLMLGNIDMIFCMLGYVIGSWDDMVVIY